MTVTAKKITAYSMEEPERATNQKIVLVAGLDDKHKITDGDIFGLFVESDEEDKGALSYYPITARLVKDKEILADYGTEYEDDEKGKKETPEKPLGYRYAQLLLPQEIKAGQMITQKLGREKYLYRIALIEEPFKQSAASVNVKPKTKAESPKTETTTETVPKTAAAKSAPVLSIADKPKK